MKVEIVYSEKVQQLRCGAWRGTKKGITWDILNVMILDVNLSL